MWVRRTSAKSFAGCQERRLTVQGIEVFDLGDDEPASDEGEGERVCEKSVIG